MITTHSLKTLMLAGAAALSIGVGGAMAASVGTTQQQAAAPQAAANQNPAMTQNGTVQYGSSDYDLFHRPVGTDPSLGVAGGF